MANNHSNNKAAEPGGRLTCCGILSTRVTKTVVKVLSHVYIYSPTEVIIHMKIRKLKISHNTAIEIVRGRGDIEPALQLKVAFTQPCIVLLLHSNSSSYLQVSPT